MLDVISVAGIPESLKTWMTWLQPLDAAITSDPARAALGTATVALVISLVYGHVREKGKWGTVMGEDTREAPEKNPPESEPKPESQPQVSGSLNIGGNLTQIGGGEIAGVIQKFGVQHRTLEGKDVTAAIARLAAYRGTSIEVSPLADSSDASALVPYIYQMLNKAGWVVSYSGSYNAVRFPPVILPPGILLNDSQVDDHVPYDTLLDCLRDDLGLQVQRGGDPPSLAAARLTISHPPS